jgi:hypothetical protein
VNRRHLISLVTLASSMTALSLTPATVMAQAPPATSQAGPPAKSSVRKHPPRMADGRPDLQGVWDFRTLTPLERPLDLAEKQVLTPEEAVALEAKTAASRVDAPPCAGNPGTYNQFWFDFGTRVVDDRRTSLVVDPANGRLPPLTEKGRERAAARAEAMNRPAIGPEDRPVYERCILGFNAGPPIIPNGYNNNLQIFQTRDYVVILTEMVHDARIVPLDGRRPLSHDVRQWKGSSRGHWEGDTLIVETTNFTHNGTGTISLPVTVDEQLHLVERFRRVDADTLEYAFTVDDPTVWTKPWSVVVPMTLNDERMYEYACHEGNYGLAGILSGARQDEKAAEGASNSKGR